MFIGWKHLGFYIRKWNHKTVAGEMALSPHSVHSGDQATLPVSAIPPPGPLTSL